jgi:hypothetical protein
MFGRFNSVTSVADVAANFDTHVTTDGTHGRISRHGSTKHLAALQDGILSFPDHSDDGTTGHVLNQTREELLGLQISIMKLHVLLSRGGELTIPRKNIKLEESRGQTTNDKSRRLKLTFMAIIL